MKFIDQAAKLIKLQLAINMLIDLRRINYDRKCEPNDL